VSFPIALPAVQILQVVHTALLLQYPPLLPATVEAGQDMKFASILTLLGVAVATSSAASTPTVRHATPVERDLSSATNALLNIEASLEDMIGNLAPYTGGATGTLEDDSRSLISVLTEWVTIFQASTPLNDSDSAAVLAPFDAIVTNVQNYTQLLIAKKEPIFATGQGPTFYGFLLVQNSSMTSLVIAIKAAFPANLTDVITKSAGPIGDDIVLALNDYNGSGVASSSTTATTPPPTSSPSSTSSLPTTSSTSSGTPTASPSPAPKSKLSGGAKGGIGVGVVIIVLVFPGGGAFFIWRRRKQRKAVAAASDSAEKPDAEDEAENKKVVVDGILEADGEWMGHEAGGDARHEVEARDRPQEVEGEDLRHEIEGEYRRHELEGRGRLAELP
jgi:hypothetical protein